jgi:hypothetical protein
MILPITAPLVISGIKALIRYRYRVDTILALSTVEEGLPFRLPKPPTDHKAHFTDMLRFFETDRGRVILALNDLDQTFKEIKTAVKTDSAIPGEISNCYALYFEATEVKPKRWAPDADDAEWRKSASTGPSEEMRLAYYVVESDRLSRNPALTRILLTTADTLLEVLGENAGTFISNPKIASVVEDLLVEFAIKHDFDDDSIQQIYKRLLNSLAIAVLENPGIVPNKPLLQALFGALNEVRGQLGNEFVARLITEDGFQALMAAFLRQVADDPSFISADAVVKDILSATLRELGNNFPELVQGDPQAVFGVLEAGLAVGAAHVDTLLHRKLNGHPLLTVVFSDMANNINELASQNLFIKELASGSIFAGFYRTILESIAANPAALATEAKIKPFTTELIATFADTLSTVKLKDTLTTEAFRGLVQDSLAVLSHYPELVVRDSRFGAPMVRAVFEAAAPLVQDGFSQKDIIIVLDAAFRTANDNLALLEIEDRLGTILSSVSGVLVKDSLKRLLTVQGRQDALLAVLQAVAVNPTIWGEFAAQDMVQPLVVGLLQGIGKDPTHLLAGPVLIESLRRSLTAVARRGNLFINGTMAPGVTQALMNLALDAARAEIGNSIDGETLPLFLERIMLAFFKSPFDIDTADEAKIKTLADGVIAEIEKR